MMREMNVLYGLAGSLADVHNLCTNWYALINDSVITRLPARIIGSYGCGMTWSALCTKYYYSVHRDTLYAG